MRGEKISEDMERLWEKVEDMEKKIWNGIE